MNLSESTRAYIYRVLLAVQPLVVAYGLITDTLAVLWLSVAAAVLSTGLAAANTSTEPTLTPLERQADADAAALDPTPGVYTGE